MKISIVIPYYRNKLMLLHQLSVFLAYPAEVRKQIEIVVVDDGTPEVNLWALKTLSAFDLTGLNIRLYRIMEDKPWNVPMARNLGVSEAAGDWIFILDIDHIIPPESIAAMLDMPKGSKYFYTFGRDACKGLAPLRLSPRHPTHCLYLIFRERYLGMGGMDEDFCGSYGLNGGFYINSVGHVERKQVDDIKIHCFLHTLIPDAQDYSRKRCNKHNHKLHKKKLAGDIPQRRMALHLPWERQL